MYYQGPLFLKSFNWVNNTTFYGEKVHQKVFQKFLEVTMSWNMGPFSLKKLPRYNVPPPPLLVSLSFCQYLQYPSISWIFCQCLKYCYLLVGRSFEVFVCLSAPPSSCHVMCVSILGVSQVSQQKCFLRKTDLLILPYKWNTTSTSRMFLTGEIKKTKGDVFWDTLSYFLCIDSIVLLILRYWWQSWSWERQ